MSAITTPFAQHPSGNFGIPIINCTEHAEQDGTHDHVVEMRDNEVRTAKLPIERRRAQHDAREAGDQKLEQESNAE